MSADYETLRHFADSWGLVMMAALFVVFAGWTFRAGAREHHRDAASSIFKGDDHG